MLVNQLLDQKGHEVYTVAPGTMVFDALAIMADKQIGSLVVMDNEKLVGILSERDYARKVILKGKSSQDTPVKEIMTTKVIHIHPNADLDQCLKLMTKHHIRHLPVVDKDRLVGILSIDDVINVT
jgi:CBS domain-containing protein